MIGQRIKLSNIVQAHNRSQITTIIINPYNLNELISLGYDSYIKIWDINTLTMVAKHLILDPYLTAIAPFNGKFLLGVGSGKILQLSSTFQIQIQYKVHQDCVSAIIVMQNYILTASYDGRILFLNKNTLHIQKSITVGTPIFSCVENNNILYGVSTPSFNLNLVNFEYKAYSTKYTHFISHKDEMFASSDQIGITRLKKNNSNIYVPADFIMNLGEVILFTSNSSVGYVSFDQDFSGSWTIMLFPQLKPGTSILTALSKGQLVYLAGESGDIAQLQIGAVNKKRCSYQQKLSSQKKIDDEVGKQKNKKILKV